MKRPFSRRAGKGRGVGLGAAGARLGRLFDRAPMDAREQRGKGRAVFTRRAVLLMMAQTGALGALGGRLYRLQVEQGQHFSDLAQANRVSTRMLAPPRGLIIDRFGEVLAGNRINWRALLLPEETTDLAGTLDRFSLLIPLEPHERARVEREAAHKRKFIPVMLREFLSWEEMAKIEVNAPDLPGVVVDVGTTRLYPHGPTFAHVIGYVGPPNDRELAEDPMMALPGARVGRSAFEAACDDALRGRPGTVQVEVNAVGRMLRELDREEGTPGSTMATTIDAGLQTALMDQLEGTAASTVVMDVRNGEVLAMVSHPSFEPSLFDSGVSQTQWKAWMDDPQTPLLNKAAAGVYPPGSTFKPAVAMAALQAGTLRPGDRIDCRGYIDIGNVRFHCWAKHGHGSLDLHGGLKFSCDVFFFEVARRTGMDVIARYGGDLGLGVRPDIELTHVREGVIPTAAWAHRRNHHLSEGDIVNAGIGQGFVQATPLQLALYTARLASGRQLDAHLTRASNGQPDPRAAHDSAPPLAFDTAWLESVRSGMWAVINERYGTAPKARLPLDGVTMAGKTGSAQVRRVSRWAREHGHFNSAELPWQYRPHALFICYAPYEAPRYALSVVIEHGNAGADVAAPLARDIMMQVLERDPGNRARPWSAQPDPVVVASAQTAPQQPGAPATPVPAQAQSDSETEFSSIFEGNGLGSGAADGDEMGVSEP